MAKEDISQEFRLKNIDEAINCFLEEIDKNKFLIKKHKKIVQL